MTPGRKVLGVIPARGGSKGIRGKNLAVLLGKPLLQYTAEAALAASSLSDTILSTDDEEIAEAGRGYGLEVPFMRPGELAADDTPTLPVLLHAVNFLQQLGREYDAVCLLQPTSPLRVPATIDGCVTMLFNSEADAVMTVLPVPHQYNPHWVYFQSDDGSLRIATGESQPISRRQELPPAYHREGSVYVVRRAVLVGEHSLYGKRVLGYPVDPKQSVNIDHPDDLRRADELLRGRVN
jgi:CMP-N-acetylneuraminic acid synthetase